jgi:hypothetical protein
VQESTAAADAEVASAVEELKALKLVVESLEKELEDITGIPRDKGAFREAVVSISRNCLSSCQLVDSHRTSCVSAGQSIGGQTILQNILFHLRWCGGSI